MGKNNAKLYDPTILLQAGIDPKTGLPLKTGGCGANLKENIRKNLRIIDEQDAVNRYQWYNLPKGLTQNILERILYYRGQGAFFYMKENDQFYFLPYALDGTIDVYGRFTGITPLPFNGKSSTDEDGKKTPWIIGLTKKPYYEVVLPEDYIAEDGSLKEEEMLEVVEDGCVLLHDYTQQISETNIPRQTLNDPVLDLMSDLMPFMRTALLSSTGIQGMRVNDEDEAANVIDMSVSINQAALTGQKYLATVGKVDFQDLSGGNVAKAEEFLLAMQSIDNFRLSTYGLDNGGLFQKRSHMLEAEQEMNNGTVGLIMQDGLSLRQEFCNIVNSIWGLGMWCEVSENAIGIDRNGDMMVGDTKEPKNKAEVADEQ